MEHTATTSDAHRNPSAGPACALNERRIFVDRRKRGVKSLLRGSVVARRYGPRRDAEPAGYYVDWHQPQLLYMTLAILLLCTADAILTLNLLTLGAQEVNVLMARLINHDVYVFSATKMALTGVGLVFLVMHANFKLFRIIEVRKLLQAFLIFYIGLIAYEIYLYFTIL